ncbi:Uncharacterised protein [Campylobacter hyointestinalis subsp. hyointestinalis]|uniref:Uncharacterized protein n=1 Tax=Campylobacter hyointestinalis subsp. hyointestinalis TaxID=91352 RepID=A0A0S4S107_CAMHY|nr:hypothetical protein [Campylobacter hyointestinalis]PPB53530.1 hypothetical protein CDQ68_02430 [Campylobacter hyointestinalis subsp. hyointestinalis]PPB66241.1 hypothetical protein CDQ75_05440 [Campylobacter hyointestinalis subsp. hyointestinalis]PPB70967.1 hypothetical protein CDQ77_02450 [Campylobacter hyointestinalis subsp. hyointestinalis]CUU80032.1 Uncharacterised protein [Campylobacter hyointestinalis subsp. hyointestinalis]
MKQLIKDFILPIFVKYVRRFIPNKYGWSGEYNTREEAKEMSTGYGNTKIIQKVRKSLLAVKNGESAYERDSVIFDKVYYSWPLLAILMFITAKCNADKL